MDESTLENLILAVISASFASKNPYPNPAAIHAVLYCKCVHVTPEQVMRAIESLEGACKIARAPHYFVTHN